MSVDAALEILGLSGEPSHEQVRRAYLRQVSRHSPERDPDGLRRVCEAFELLKGLAEAGRTRPIASPLAPSDLDEPDVGEPVLSPGPVLDTVLALMAEGHFRRADELLDALEDHLALPQAPGGLGPEVGARWNLARELRATSDLDVLLARALAQGLIDGQLSRAAEAANAAQRQHGAAFQRHMQEHAPALWEQLHQQPPTPARHPAFTIGGWSGVTVVMGALLLMQLFGAAISPNDSTGWSRPTAPSATHHQSFAQQAASYVSGLLKDPAERRKAAWEMLEKPLSVGDCQGVRELWRVYRGIVALAHSPSDVEGLRRQQILDKCPELKDLLAEPPP